MEKINKTKGGFSLEEEIAALIRPSKSALKQLLVYVEGIADIKIYRAIAFQVASPVQITFSDKIGRNTIFALFEAVSARKDEILRPLLFFADQDLFVFGSIPESYSEIFFTTGYCIENDLFQDGEVVLKGKIYPENEKNRFDSLVNSVIDWYAYEINLWKEGKAADAKIDISLLNPSIVGRNEKVLTKGFLKERNYVPPPIYLKDQITENYLRLLRGKFLFEILSIIFQSRGRNDIKPRSEELWLDCITEGLRDPLKQTNCNRIAQIIKERLKDLN